MLGGSLGRQMQTQRDHGGCREPMPLVEALSRWPEVRAPHRLCRANYTTAGDAGGDKATLPPQSKQGGGVLGRLSRLGHSW